MNVQVEESGKKWNMFFGTYEHTIDEKGRLVIPRKMREEAGVRVFIMKGFDGALSIFKESEFERLAKEFDTLPFSKKNIRAYLRIQLASACELEIDKLGRVQIPTSLLAKYQIGKEVVVIGAGDHMEVWDKAVFAEYEKAANEDFEKLAEDIDKEE